MVEGAEKQSPGIDARGGNGTGLIVGRFLPPHRGHQYLFDFARHDAQSLTIALIADDRDRIPAAVRGRWLQDMAPGCSVLHVEARRLAAAEASGEVVPYWKALFRQQGVPSPGRVYTRDPGHRHLASALGCRIVPVDWGGELFPESSSQLIANPWKHWSWIPPCVRPWFVRRICLVGAECTGKSWLTKELALLFGTVYTYEYARPMVDFQKNVCTEEDATHIARGQIASEDAMARRATRLLFCDTDTLTTKVWCHHLRGRCEQWIENEAERRRYDLTLLLAPDVPWTEDPQRCLASEEDRLRFHETLRSELERLGRPYRQIGGPMEYRLGDCIQAVSAYLESEGLGCQV